MAEKTVERMDISEFLPAYIEACDNEMTVKEFAESIGIEPMSVTQRISKLRKGLGEDGDRLPKLQGSPSGRVKVAEKALGILEQLGR